MNRVLTLAAVAETMTGIALLMVPSLVALLLLGEGLTGVAVEVARVTGVALIGLGLACWPGPPLLGILTYSAGITLYLAYVGIVDSFAGVLLWPVVGLHLIMTAFLIQAQPKAPDPKSIRKPSTLRLGTGDFLLSVCWYSHDWSGCLRPYVGNREHKHYGRKNVFRSDICVVNPKPAAIILNLD